MSEVSSKPLSKFVHQLEKVIIQARMERQKNFLSYAEDTFDYHEVGESLISKQVNENLKDNPIRCGVGLDNTGIVPPLVPHRRPSQEALKIPIGVAPFVLSSSDRKWMHESYQEASSIYGSHIADSFFLAEIKTALQYVADVSEVYPKSKKIGESFYSKKDISILTCLMDGQPKLITCLETGILLWILSSDYMDDLERFNYEKLKLRVSDTGGINQQLESGYFVSIDQQNTTYQHYKGLICLDSDHMPEIKGKKVMGIGLAADAIKMVYNDDLICDLSPNYGTNNIIHTMKAEYSINLLLRGHTFDYEGKPESLGSKKTLGVVVTDDK